MVSFSRYQTKQGMRWAVQWRTPDHHQTKKRGFTRKIDAQRWAARNITTPMAEGTYTSPTLGRATVSDVWQDLRPTLGATRKPTTLRTYDNAWRNHVSPAIGNHPIGRVTRAQLQGIITASAGPSIGRATKAVIGHIWKHAHDMGANVPTGITHGLATPRATPREHRYLTMRQLVTLSRAAEHYGKGTLVLLLGVTGLRWGEATALRTKDIDPAHDLLHVRLNSTYANGHWYLGTPKNGHERTVPMPHELTLRLTRLTHGTAPDHPVFGRMLSPSGGHGWWRLSLRKAGLPYMRVHDLRHTAASLAVANGADIKVLQRMLGHSSAAMTLDVYADLFEGRDRQVADRMSAALDAALDGSRGNTRGNKIPQDSKNSKHSKQDDGSHGTQQPQGETSHHKRHGGTTPSAGQRTGELPSPDPNNGVVPTHEHHDTRVRGNSLGTSAHTKGPATGNGTDDGACRGLELCVSKPHKK